MSASRVVSHMLPARTGCRRQARRSMAEMSHHRHSARWPGRLGRGYVCKVKVDPFPRKDESEEAARTINRPEWATSLYAVASPAAT